MARVHNESVDMANSDHILKGPSVSRQRLCAVQTRVLPHVLESGRGHGYSAERLSALSVRTRRETDKKITFMSEVKCFGTVWGLGTMVLKVTLVHVAATILNSPDFKNAELHSWGL